MTKKHQLEEKIYSSTTAIAYHRTTEKDFIDIIKNDEFRPGTRGGTMYGPGLYCTYELESQLNDRMRNAYGPYLIKYKIPIKNYLIFDKDHAEQIFGKGKGDIVQQLQNMDPDYERLPLQVIEANRQIRKEYQIISRVMNKYRKLFTPIAVISFSELYDGVQEKFSRYEEGKIWIKNFVNSVNSNERNDEVISVIFKTLITDVIREKYTDIKNNLGISDNSWDPNWAIINSQQLTAERYNIDKSVNLFISVASGKSNIKMEDISVVISYRNPVNTAINEIEMLQERHEKEKHTSVFVQEALPLIRENFPQVEGLIFTGRGDGKVIIAYNWNECIPLAAYTETPRNIDRGYIVQILNYIFTNIKQDYLGLIQNSIYTQEEEEKINKVFSDIGELKELKDLRNLYQIIKLQEIVENILKEKKGLSTYELDYLYTTDRNIDILIEIYKEYSYSTEYTLELKDLQATQFVVNKSLVDPTYKKILIDSGFKKAYTVNKDNLIQIAKSSSEVLQVFIDKAKQSKRSNKE